ncbi:hypothetical protein QR98_0056580 [Sarcoptes scabiei]|uniref:Uncharacterized protein n=1 Tax=Sarcoptes scabiei TaxID=52283 RepID=A0A132A874_SARSC|nr:hypothetical protein QR98_0056580 [Sarcoptes scabiei]
MIDGLDDEVQSNSRSSTPSKQSEDIQAQNNEVAEKLSTTNVSVKILDKNNSKQDHGEGYVSKNQNQIIKTSSFARKLNGILPSSNRNGPNFLDELKSKSQTWSHRNLSNVVAEQKAVNQDQIDGSISIENLNITSKIQDLPSKGNQFKEFNKVLNFIKSIVEKILNQPLPPPPLPSSSLFNSLKSITISEKESVRKTQTLLAPKGWYKTDDRNGESLSSTSTIHQRDALLDEIKTFQTKSKLRKVNVNKPFSLQIN